MSNIDRGSIPSNNPKNAKTTGTTLRRRMKIQIDPHTLKRAEERGTNEDEIKDVIEMGAAVSAKYGRIGKAKVYDFKQKRHHKYYEQKRVEVFYSICATFQVGMAQWVVVWWGVVMTGVAIQVRVPAFVRDALKEKAGVEGRCVSDLVSDAIYSYHNLTPPSQTAHLYAAIGLVDGDMDGLFRLSGCLSERQRKYVFAQFGVGTGKPQTMAEIAAPDGVCRQMVNQILVKAKKKMMRHVNEESAKAN